MNFYLKLLQYDKNDVCKALGTFSNQLLVGTETARKKKFPFQQKFNKIIIAGMGGSAQSGELLKNMLDEIVEIVIVRDYNIPKSIITTDTLIIISSYSGNTEESISALENILNLDYNIICVASGGTILELANKFSLPYYTLDTGFQPRFAVAMSLALIFGIIKKAIEFPEHFDKFPSIDLVSNLKSKSIILQGKKTLEYEMNIAEKLVCKIPIIYSSNKLSGANNRFRGQLQENAKIPSYSSYFPELNHNEINAFTSNNPLIDKYFFVFLTDQDDNHRNIKRQEITAQILKENGYSTITMNGQGESFTDRLIDLVYSIDIVTFYLSIMTDQDPSDINQIEMFKKRME